jgi:hypothetical protein
MTTTKNKRGGEGLRLADIHHSTPADGGRRCDDDIGVAVRKNKRGGETPTETNKPCAAHDSRRTIATTTPNARISGDAAGGEYAADAIHLRAACRDLQVLQRYRADAIQSRIRIDNAIQATIARYYGYSAKLEEAERKAKWKAAGDLLTAVRKGSLLGVDDAEIVRRAGGLILNSNIASDGYQAYIDAHSKQIESLVAGLHIAPWVKSVRGLGLCSVGCILGETGDLSNYANPAKVWKRLGLAPFNGKMPSSWRSQGGLTKEEWIEVGYSPRRRSLLYVVSDCLIKQNDGAYRAKYDSAKAAKLALADDKWPKLRCHRHGMLLAVKELVLDLWLQWHGKAKKASA